MYKDIGKKLLAASVSAIMLLSLILTNTSLSWAAGELTNIALGKNVTVSDEDRQYIGKNAVDGNLETKWQVTDLSKAQTIVIDLGEVTSVHSINLVWAENFATHYKLYLAGNNEIYNLLLFHEEGTGGVEEWEVPEGSTARYVKLELIQPMPTQTSIGLNEIEVMQQSQTQPDNYNLALQKPAWASGSELNLERLGPAGAFDGDRGIDDSKGRWASQNITVSPQWIYVDLEDMYEVGSIHIYWQAAYATVYKVEYAVDDPAVAPENPDKDWILIEDVKDGKGGFVSFDCEPKVSARYIRMYATQSNGLGTNKPVSIWEMEVYEEARASLQDLADKFEIGEIPEGTMIMPSFSYEEGMYTIDFFCSDTDFVVDDEGNIYKPLIDKDILVTYIATDHVSGQKIEIRDISVTIPGQYSANSSKSDKPVTVPTLQEWKGDSGIFTLTENTRLAVGQNDEELLRAAEITSQDIQDLFGIAVSVTREVPQAGDIILTMEGADLSIRDQGYVIEITDRIEIKGAAYQGVFYGTRSVLQAMVYNQEEEGRVYINQGIARDYPKYEIRKFMFDVARKYFPMWYMEDFVKYASWFKFSDIQVHINDSSYNTHFGFRLESDIEGLTSQDGYYTKDEYRQFQYFAQDYGIRIITEIDTPAHSECFVDTVRPDLGFNRVYLDIRLADAQKKQAVYDFIADLFDEYMGGDDPVFVTDAFNVGLDEFNSSYREDMTQYSKYVIDLIYEKYNKTPMAWASFGCLDTATTKMPDTPIMDAWANYAVSLKALFEQGYNLVNATNKYGYIVPGGNNGYPDFADTKSIYENMTPGTFRDKQNNGVNAAEGHPQIKGGSASLWNDRGIFSGTSIYDVFLRQQSIIPVYSQIFWYGTDDDKDYSTWQQEVDSLGLGPDIENLNKSAESKSDLLYHYDMSNVEKVSEEKIKLVDISGNGYDAVVKNGNVTLKDGENVLRLDGDGAVQMPHNSAAYPYTVSFDISLDTGADEDIILFKNQLPKEECNTQEDYSSGMENTMIYLASSGGRYQLAYERENYYFEHDYLFETEQTYNITFSCDEKYTRLYVNGILASTINGPVHPKTYRGKSLSSGPWMDSASIYLPLQTIAENLHGELGEFKVFNRVLNADEIKEMQETVTRTNLAAFKNVEVSGLDAAANGTQNGENAVDENNSTRWSSDRNDAKGWIVIDLGAVYDVAEVQIDWEGAAGKKYNVQVSLDGSKFNIVKEITDGVGGENRVIKFDDVSARYVKLELLEKTDSRYGYSIWEIRIFERTNRELERELDKYMQMTASMDIGSQPGQIDVSAFNSFKAYTDGLKEIASGALQISEEELIQHKTQLMKNYKILAGSIVKEKDTVDKSELESLLKNCKQLVKDAYTEESWNRYLPLLQSAEKVYGNADALQEEVDHTYNMLSLAVKLLKEKKDNSDVIRILEIFVKEAEAAVQSGEVDKAIPSVQVTFKKALEDAQILLKEINPDKDAVLDAAITLLEQIHRLGIQAGSKQYLESLVELCETIDLNDYEDGQEKNVFKKALEDAWKVLDDRNATAMEIEAAYNNLYYAAKELKGKTDIIDKSTLQTAIELGQDIYDKLDMYVEAGKGTYIEKLNNAKHIYDTGTSQDEFDKAAAELMEAMAALRYKADKSVLQAKTALAESLDLSLYTEVTVKVFQEVFSAAQEILNDDTLTYEEDQDKVDQMVIQIERAVAQLVRSEEVDTDDTSEQSKREPEDNNQTDPEGESKDNNQTGQESDYENEEDTKSTVAGKGTSGKNDEGKSNVKTGDGNYRMIMFLLSLNIFGSCIIVYCNKKRNWNK